jgi:SpoIID/LytB domain protein
MAASLVCAASLLVLLASLFVLLAPRGETLARRAADVAPRTEAEVDAALQRAAERALGGRSGTMLVLDARSGRLRAAVNSRLAFEESFAPGSAIKPFTLLAALRAGAASEDSRASCGGRYEHEGFAVNCSHPRFKTPLGTRQALAHSCNVFFARAGEGAGAGRFLPILSEFGFGLATGGGGPREQAGAMPRAGAGVAEMLGESDHLRVTPAQLLAAYAALFNGGRLFAPRRAGNLEFSGAELVGLERSRPRVAERERALLVEGMRGAILEGTAARAGLGDVPLYIFGKTGTSTPRAGYGSQGWFVGLAADGTGQQVVAGGAEGAPPEKVSLVVLVFLRRGRGSEAASVSKPVFDEYARALAAGRTETDDPLAEDSSEASLDGAEDDAGAFEHGDVREGESRVRVRLGRARATVTLGLEDYVYGVVTAEGSVEDEPEALKALAVAARTYALKNLKRHHSFDLCDSTHCQRFVPVSDESVRPRFYESARRAVLMTAGEVLRDARGQIAESYFSASCGGVTADIGSLWGVRRPPAHLRGSRDEACDGDDGSRAWTDAISKADLLRALRSDERSDVGERLDAVRIARRDSSGRAETIMLEGERRRFLRGWDFKIIVGRTLGWNVLKSSRFEVRRAGDKFVFRGSGFGHGLGLCQTGAHHLAARGATYRQILGRYLPGVTVAAAQGHETSTRKVDESQALRNVFPEANAPAISNAPAANDAFANAEAPIAVRAQSRRTLAGEGVRLSYPARLARAEAEGLLREFEAARAEVARRARQASLDASVIGVVQVVLHETTGDFVGATGQPSWVAAVTRGRAIELQPLAVLRRRGVLRTTLRHELVHVACEALGRGRAPLWLIEGLAAYVAGEGQQLARHAPKRPLNVAEIERGLHAATSAEEMRTLYAAAYAEVAALVRREGEAAVWRRALRN